MWESSHVVRLYQAITLIKQHNLAFGPNKASNGGSVRPFVLPLEPLRTKIHSPSSSIEQFAFAGESLTTTELTPEELDAKVKGTKDDAPWPR